MAHTIRDKKKLLNRVRRIRGQIAAVEKALDRFHVVDPDHQPTSEKAKAAQELIDVVKAYLK
jgi:DNA-binding FrmR family transcriptional regulator